MKEILTAREAGKVLECNPQKVREHIKAGRWDFGECISPREKSGNRTYLIYTHRLIDFFGIPESVAEKRLERQERGE